MLWEREKKKNGGGVRLGAEREEEGADRIYSENCARGAGAVGEGLMDTAYFLFQKLSREIENKADGHSIFSFPKT